MEAWYAIMGIGAVCHTLNPRLFPDQLCYIMAHAEDKILFTDLTFLPTVIERRADMRTIEKVIVMTDEGHMASVGLDGALCFETLIEQSSEDCEWGGFDEKTAAGLCYTSGTTGNPKGVLYSHRTNFLHTPDHPADRRDGHLGARRGAADRADVPRQRLGAGLLLPGGGLQDGDAGPEARRRFGARNCWRPKASPSPPRCRRYGRCCSIT